MDLCAQMRNPLISTNGFVVKAIVTILSAVLHFLSVLLHYWVSRPSGLAHYMRLNPSVFKLSELIVWLNKNEIVKANAP